MEPPPREEKRGVGEFPAGILDETWLLGSTPDGKIVRSGSNHVHAKVVSMEAKGADLGWDITATFKLYGLYKYKRSFLCKDARQWAEYTWSRPDCLTAHCEPK